MKKQKFLRNDNNCAIAYYRFSSHTQNEASIDQQREAAQLYADGHGYTIVKEYVDAGISGTTDERPGFQLMLSEIAELKPATLILWRIDRLGRDLYLLAVAKNTIRKAGCRIECTGEANVDSEMPEAALFEAISDGFAAYYSRQLSVNITRGMRYNAEHCLFNGHKLFGYAVDDEKRYVLDNATAPVARRIFETYADGMPMVEICAWLNAEGWVTTRGYEFTVNSVRSILRNRSYIGEYHECEIVTPGGMPAVIDVATFERAQRRLAENKRRGAQRKMGARQPEGNEAPRYWLTGKLFCGECGSPMAGAGGRGKMGKQYWYYRCPCKKRRKKYVSKEKIEQAVICVLRSLLDDSENVTSLAVDLAVYWAKTGVGMAYINGLERELADVNKRITNLMEAVEQGIIASTTKGRLAELERRREGFEEAIEVERAKAALMADEHSIKAEFARYVHADLEDPEVRDVVMEYFVDRIYLYDDRLVVTSTFEGENDLTYGLEEVDGATEESPPDMEFDGGFDCFGVSSTNC